MAPTITLIESLQPFMFYDKNINGAKDYLKRNAVPFLSVKANVKKAVETVEAVETDEKAETIKQFKTETETENASNKVISGSEKKVCPVVLKEHIFYPREEDNLFWCFYLMKNGHSAYELIEHRNIVYEMQLKIEYVEKLRKNKNNLKTHSHKFDSLSHLEGVLSGSKRINLETFVTLCFLEQINIMIINKSTYYQLFDDSDSSAVVFMVCKDPKTKRYGYKLLNKEEMENYRTNYYHIENIIKPIKAISAYKVDDLVSICEKVSISVVNNVTGKRKTKQDMYESLVQYFS
jgi:hypothetical protein